MYIKFIGYNSKFFTGKVKKLNLTKNKIYEPISVIKNAFGPVYYILFDDFNKKIKAEAILFLKVNKIHIKLKNILKR